MKVLFDHSQPFLLAHGGIQRQIERTKTALEQLGMVVELLRWWDEHQSGDLIHFFGKPSVQYLTQAQVKGLPVAMTSFHSVAANRSKTMLRLQALVSQALSKLTAGHNLNHLSGWKQYHLCALNVVGLQAEQDVLEQVHRVPPERIARVPLGVAETFFKVPRTKHKVGEHLVTIGSIWEVKRSVELALAAREAKVPVLFVGKPYSKESPYWQRFEQLIDQRWVQYQNHVESEEQLATVLAHARGFVIMSQYENWCLAAHEAAAVGLPLLLPDLPWARERFGGDAQLFRPGARNTAAALKRFFDLCPSLPSPQVKVPTWRDVAVSLKAAYERALGGHAH